MKRNGNVLPIKPGHILLVVFALLLLTTSLYIYQSWYNNRDYQARDKGVRQTLLIMRGYAEIRTAMAESESAMRSYSQGEAEAGQRLTGLHNELEKSLSHTRNLLIDSIQKRNFTRLCSTLHYLKHTQTRLLQQPTTDSLNTQAANYYQQARQWLDQLDRRQNLLLQTRAQASEAAASRSFTNTVQGAALVVVFILLLLLRLNRDITRRQKAENSARENEKKYRLLIEGAAVTIFTTDLEGRFTYVSEKCQTLTGYTVNELLGKTYKLLVAPQSLAMLSEAYRNQFVKRIPETTQEFEIIDSNGRHKWVEQQASLVLENDVPLGLQCIVKDISEKKEAEARLKESQRITQSLLDHTREGFFMVDRSFRILLVNRQARQGMELVAGKPVRLGMSLFDVMVEKDKEIAHNNFERVFAGEQVEVEADYDTPLGKQWIRISHSPVRNEAGEISGAAIVTHDITAARQQAEQLQQADQKIRAMLSSTHEGFYMIDHDYRILMVNEASRQLAYRATGKDLNLGMNIADFIGPDRLEIYRQHIENAKAGRRQEIETMVLMQDGECWFHNTYFPVKDENGQVIAVCATTQDITERKLVDKAMERIRLEKEEYQFRLQSILDNTPMVVFIKNTEGRYLVINQAFREIFKLNDEQVIGKTDFDFDTPEAAKRYREADELVIFTHENITAEEKVMLDDGEHNLLIVKFPLFDRYGKVYGVGCIATDITERVRQRQQLIEARQKAENAERLQEQFLANMSHEIRTPMNGIIGMTNILMNTTLNEQQREFLQIVRHSSDNLMGLINDVLDLSKIKAGKLTVEKTAFEPVKVMRNVLAPFQLPAHEKNIALQYEIDATIPPQLMGDPLRITQVLTNLIGNALKFTEQGSINIKVHLKQHQADDCVLAFAVIDTGIGIPEDRLQQVFDSFEQAEAGTARKYGGTGLGLSISRNLVQLMGGELQVSSQYGHGACFSFELPFTIVHETAAANLAAPGTIDLTLLNGKRLLVAEDNEINQLVIYQVLDQVNIQPHIVNNGREAVEWLEAGNTVDAVILDLRMPLMNGFQTAVYLREKLRQNIPIVAMTASALRNEKQKCRELGMNGYLTKPFAPAKLFEILYQLLVMQNGSTMNDDNTEETAHTTSTAYNLAYLHEMDDTDYTREILSMFLSTTEPALKEMNQAALHEDWTRLYALAHKLKSATGLLQMQQMTQLLADLEQLTREKPDPGTVEGVLRRLEEQYSLLQPMIESELTALPLAG